jgi:hypothetical protein
VHAGSTGFDHRLHQLERVEHATEAGFRVGHDRGEEVGVVLAFAPLDLELSQRGVRLKMRFSKGPRPIVFCWK